MNIAPLLLERSQGFELLDSKYRQAVSREADGVDPETQSYVGSLLRLYPSEVLRVDQAMPVGLFAMSLGEWSAAVAEVPVVDGLSAISGALLRATPISGERMLLFPDNPWEDFVSAAVHAPATVGLHTIALNVLATAFGRRGKPLVRALVTSVSGGCTESIEGEFGKRRFTCTRSGCSRECKEQSLIVGGETFTFACRC
jgi:hypothetical protein